jgi:hypothetical protein
MNRTLGMVSLLTLAILDVAIVGQALIVALGITYTPPVSPFTRRRSPWG